MQCGAEFELLSSSSNRARAFAPLGSPLQAALAASVSLGGRGDGLGTLLVVLLESDSLAKCLAVRFALLAKAVDSDVLVAEGLAILQAEFFVFDEVILHREASRRVPLVVENLAKVVLLGCCCRRLCQQSACTDACAVTSGRNGAAVCVTNSSTGQAEDAEAEQGCQAGHLVCAKEERECSATGQGVVKEVERVEVAPVPSASCPVKA
mmetsp:Transcript_20093/g.60681  ORF Transcript_20093/g.60681 Transcript_20093/m.60681 type:complete len:208 (+) Transcript_20093:274-897(+)